MRRRGYLAGAVGLLSLTGLPYLAYLGAYALKRPHGSPATKRPAEPTVSVVLPTYNEQRIVESKLEEIVALEYPLEKVEVVVVDSSDDRTPELVEAFFRDLQAPTLTLICEDERRGLAPALNEAYAAASGEMVVKTDCDSRIDGNALREAAANLADPAVGAVTGRNAEVLGGSGVERGYRDVQALVQTLESHLDSTLIFHGPFCAFEREAIVPIDEDSIADDSELALKIRKGGKRAVFDPAIEYKEAAHSGFAKRRKQKDRRAMGLVRLLWRQRDMLGGYGAYGRAVLPFNWWFMVVSPWLVVSLCGLLLVGGLLAGLLPGLVVLAGGLLTVLLGSRDALGPLQPLYAVFDTQVSLFRAGLRLLGGEGDGTWEVDLELREVYDD
ncbi:glycosyltransferase [Halalkalicoccus jeotgali]|uniref:Family 2 glycosyl transferase n=1 Tax=Halalkalicoccus jeotgali (strain DSM 18796 / CECT 7217 / JCM 14584 / KCTC 4019 / B3) TaxID=795797 RepID=D8J4P1_HALJB|nr:glycosyltransferase [Halalkalicoccus jeotgali]ADJ15508.1 glycosyl transferase family 2 [Halalkalicoccus jeotgali B3]ELY36083.1 family 2 glycosyl transferase [Halalkalicoccus jeotgali B3]